MTFQWCFHSAWVPLLRPPRALPGSEVRFVARDGAVVYSVGGVERPPSRHLGLWLIRNTARCRR